MDTLNLTNKFIENPTLSNLVELRNHLRHIGESLPVDTLEKFKYQSKFNSEEQLLKFIDIIVTKNYKEFIDNTLYKLDLRKVKVTGVEALIPLHNLLLTPIFTERLDNGTFVDSEDVIKDYGNRLISLYKRTYNSTNVLQSKERSSISSITTGFIMSMLLREAFNLENKDLIEAIDLSSLIRLSITNGGQTIKVPTYQEVIEIIGSVYYFYLINFEYFTKDKALAKVNKILDLNLTKIRLGKNTKYLLKNYSQEIKNPSSSLSVTFDNLVQFLTKTQEELIGVVTTIDNPKEFSKAYAEINDSILKLVSGISTIEK